ncbi:TonB-dependent receptor [Burkholderia multivorans]|uniref:TonB-dependent receptor n=1 Tax=Burkholderia multivorans TaxID=87883 RepID=UPI002ED91BD1
MAVRRSCGVPAEPDEPQQRRGGPRRREQRTLGRRAVDRVRPRHADTRDRELLPPVDGRPARRRHSVLLHDDEQARECRHDLSGAGRPPQLLRPDRPRLPQDDVGHQHAAHRARHHAGADRAQHDALHRIDTGLHLDAARRQSGQRDQRQGLAPQQQPQQFDQQHREPDRAVRRIPHRSVQTQLHDRHRAVARMGQARHVHGRDRHRRDLQQRHRRAVRLQLHEPVVAESRRSVGRFDPRNNDYAHARTTTKSIYGFDTIELTPRWQLNAGVRVDDYSTRFTDTKANGGKTYTRDDTLFNWQLGAVFKPAQNGSIYASYATSSTPAGMLLGEGSETQSLTPGRGGVGSNADQLSPEKNRSIEVGTKWNVLNDKLSLTAALFQIDTTNARVTLPNNQYAMVGNKRVQGLELGVAGQLTKQWQVFGGYTYMKSELRDNGKDTANNGHRFPNTPKHSFTMWTNYDVTPKFTVGGGAFYMSEVFGDPANLRAVPSYWRFDAMAQYRINKKLDLQLNVNNLFNRTYFDQAYPAHYASIAPGRSAFVTLNARY